MSAPFGKIFVTVGVEKIDGFFAEYFTVPVVLSDERHPCCLPLRENRIWGPSDIRLHLPWDLF